MRSKLVKRKYAMGAALAVMSAVAVWAIAAGSAASAPARTTASAGTATVLENQLAIARAATAKYANNLALAKANGYGIITKMIPNDGLPLHEPEREGLRRAQAADPRVRASGLEPGTLGAIEWVFTSKPAKPPLPGATYGAFGAGCHYKDGTFVPATAQSACPAKAPGTGAAFNFWHPNLVTMHVWLWYPNPTGLFASTNPLVTPFNAG